MSNDPEKKIQVKILIDGEESPMRIEFNAPKRLFDLLQTAYTEQNAIEAIHIILDEAKKSIS